MAACAAVGALRGVRYNAAFDRMLLQDMELIRGWHNLRPHHRGCVATIGAFDGVHLGHQALLRRLMDRGRELGLPSVVICFEPLPREYFAPIQAPARIMSFREKFIALRNLGLDRVLRIRFDESFRSLTAEAFIRRVFVEGLDIRYIVVGDDLRFGHDRRGDSRVLRAAGERYGFEVDDTPTVVVDGDRVSSTRIRQALEAGDFDRVEALLGRPYSIIGKVVYGRQLGSRLGIPTANLELHRLRAPVAGVYAVDVRGIGDEVRFGVANVGTRPTVDELIKANLEVHILDFDGNLYGRTLEVTFRSKIREEKKFSSLEELEERIRRDIAVGRDYFGLGGAS